MTMFPRETRQAWLDREFDIDIEEQWVRHLNRYQLNFPRDIGFDVRFPVESKERYTDIISWRVTESNTYTNVYSKPMMLGSIYDTFFVDIDADIESKVDIDEDSDEKREEIFSEEMRKAFFEVRKVIYTTQEEYGFVPRVYFSGSRGFAVYFDFPAMEVDYGAINSAVHQVLHDADVDMDFVDSSVFEHNRLCRVPYTLNWNGLDKYGLGPLLCLPIDPTWRTDTVIDEIKNPEIQLPVNHQVSREFGDVIRQTETADEYESFNYTNETFDVVSSKDPDEALEDVEKLMKYAENVYDGRQRMLHFILVPNLLEANYSSDAVHRVCKQFINDTGKMYDGTEYEEYVQRGIQRTVEGKGEGHHWKPWSFERFITTYDELFDVFVG